MRKGWGTDRWGLVVFGLKAKADATTKYRGPSPFDYTQGQDDDVFMVEERKATATADPLRG